MYIVVCPGCNNGDVEKLEELETYWCHNCGEEWNESELKIMEFDKYFKKN